MEIICGIYKITSPTGSIYIGQSINILKRFGAYKNLQCKAQLRLIKSFKAHGVQSHEFEIIHRCEPSELNKLEKYYVDFFGSFNSKKGMNLIDGGGSYGKRSEETKRRNSESVKGEKNWQYGKKQPKEMVDKRNNANRGKKRTAEQIQRISASRIGKPAKKGWKHSQETKDKIREYHNRPDIALKKSNDLLGEKNPMWGKRHSAETMEKIVKKLSGQNRTKEFKENLSAKRKGAGNPMYGISLVNSGMTGKKHSNCFYEKRCILLLNIETGIFYYGFKEAGEVIGMKKGTLAERFRKNRETPFQIV